MALRTFRFRSLTNHLNCDSKINVFGIVYIPQEYTSDDVFRQIENEYLNFSVNYSNICLLGDFNSRTAAAEDLILVDK